MKMLITSHKSIVLLLAALLLIVPPVSNAQTYSHIYVDAANGVNAATGRGTAAAPYKTITFALLISNKNNLPDPWHVHIRPGTYTADPAKPATEREIFPIQLRTDMIFEGTTNAKECIIDAQHTGRTIVPILLGENAEGVHIRHLTIQNMLMYLDDTHPKPRVSAQIILRGAGQKPNTLKECIVRLDPKIKEQSIVCGGLWTNMPLVLVENTFSNNDFRAVIVFNNSVVATNNTFKDINWEGLYIGHNSPGAISTGDITGNFFGSPIQVGRNVTIRGSLNGNIRDNTFNGGGVFIEGTMNGDVTGNTFSHCRGRSYSPQGHEGGGGLAVKTLNGNITHNVFTNNEPRKPGTPGGAVHVGTLNGNLTHNTFTNNITNHYGGGVYVETFNGNLKHNTFTNNTCRFGGAGGGFFANDMTGDIAYNEFTGNTGGGVTVAEKPNGNVTHNIFDSNSVMGRTDHAAGGLMLGWRPASKSEGIVEVSNNIFFNNKVGDQHQGPKGVTLMARVPVHIINNVFMTTADELSEGKYKPHIWLASPESRLHNNIFDGMHVAIYIDGASALPITHNIFHDIRQDIVSQGGGGLGNDVAFWELLAENASNNLAVAPLFVDPLGAKDFHLQAGSPAIDAGTNAYAPDDDLDGAARPAGAAVDIGPYEYGATKRPNTVADVPSDTPKTDTPVTDVTETDTPTTDADVPKTTDATVNISPASVESAAVGKQIDFSLSITGGEAVAGYQATLQFDTTALRYVSSANSDYLPAGAFFVDPVVEGNLIKLNAISLAGESKGNGTLATFTFEVIAAKASTLTLSDVLLTNSAGETFVPTVENAEITEPTRLKEDVNGDGTVNIADLALVAANLGKTGPNAADVNGDGTVNIADLALVAGALGTTAAAPSLYPEALEMFTAAEVKQWLSTAQQLDLTDTTAQRGVLFLQQLLAALTPRETALLPNYPNPFNPETWIPYQLAKPADVTVRIYAMDGKLVRTLALGHQAVGKYHHRSHAAYWDGKNEVGEFVASGVYFYTLTAGDFTATRKMLIRK
ncbi:MAG: dockerin type I domain-containing protein [Candidatus Poribacteria bacterium]|nr:dockerin type I domain-containing protein [Candidatus Poribacteria bacterium]